MIRRFTPVLILAAISFTAATLLSQTHPEPSTPTAVVSNDELLEGLKSWLEHDERFPDLQELLRRLKEAPPGDQFRLDAIAMARPFASPVALSEANRDAGISEARIHWNAHGKLRTTHQILEATGSMRVGMTIETAYAIMGAPSHRRPDRDSDTDGIVHVWYYLSPMHVNPRLDLHVVDGLVVKIHWGAG